MVMSDDIEAAGRGLPKAYRDVMFLRERLLALLPNDIACDHRWTVADGKIEDAPLPLIYSKVSAPAENSEETLHVFPIDLARYTPAQIHTWVAATQCREVIVVHSRSQDALRSAGYRGGITLAPIPYVTPAPLPKKQLLRMASIFRCLDSRERHYDPEWLMPGYQPQITEEPVAVVNSIDDHRDTSITKNLRFRLGATKRHFLNLVEELFEPRSDVADLVQGEAAERTLTNSRQVVNLTVTGTVFTMVLDEFSDESCWADPVKAFCAAFRFEQDATLLVFLSGDAHEQHARDFDHVLCALYPFSCRLLLVQGALDDMEYEALMACTDVYVDVNRRATLCADLRRFSAAGVLTIGFPVRDESEGDAMLVDFPVHHCDEPGFCDFDDNPRYQTVVRRLDWESLVAALTKARAQVISTVAGAGHRVDRVSSTSRREQQKIAWQQALRKIFA